ncbi:MAG: hypothetical protein H7Y36_06860 [Armatimonadetes bacterium]|nr:hypothetical protein [Akkermansiaceae bacterium]
MEKILAICFVCALSACGLGSRPGGNDMSEADTTDAVDAIATRKLLQENSGAVSSDPATIRLPILRAVGCGSPGYAIMKDGSYIATYRFGNERYLKIVGTLRSFPGFSYSPDGKINILDQAVSHYSTGNEDPEFTTRDNYFAAPDGRNANFIFVFGGNRDQVTQAALYREFPKLAW